MIKNKNLKNLALQYIERYKLNLDGLNVLVPTLEQEPLLAGAIVAMAGANNIYIFDPATDINKNCKVCIDEINFNAKIIGSLPGEVLASLNIILKSRQIPLQENKLGFFAKKNAVVSLFPENLDFLNTQDINMEAITEENLSLIGIDPEDAKVGLYQQFAHILIKRCHEQGIDILKSKILLVGNGGLLNTALSMLKSLGAVVYTYNTTSGSNQSYILKHLKNLDAIIAIDYPQTDNQIIGSKGVISICDIIDQCPMVKVLHLSGKTETGSLKLGNIKYFPENIEQDTLNLNIKELGDKGVAELAVASLKIAEDFLRLGKISLNSEKSVVTYNILNRSSLLLDRKN